MSLYDKFGIIENHLQCEDIKKITSKIDNYLENFLNSDIHVLIPDYINQLFWFNKINSNVLSINIDLYIKNYLIQRRNNIRIFIKKENFDFSSLNKFIKNFIIKLEYLNAIMKSIDNKIIKDGIKQLNNLIISDSLIMLYIEEQIIIFDKHQKADIEILIKLTKTLGKYDENETFNKMLKTFGNVFKKYLNNMDEYPLPENIKRIQKLCNNINFCKTLTTYYNFIEEEFKFFGIHVIHFIIENFTDIIRSNTIDEIEYTFNYTWSDLSKIVLDAHFDGKEELVLNLSKEIIYVIDRVLNQPIQSDILKLINILKYVDNIVKSQNCREIINQKISSSLSSEELLDHIHITINDLIYNQKSTEVFKLLKFIIGIKDKDIFISKYYQYLIKRLINMMSKFHNNKKIINSDSFSSYIQCEKNILELLKIKFGEKLCYKINKVITDTELSYDDNLNFAKLASEIVSYNTNITVITTSYSNWDVNQTEGIITNKIIESIKNTQIGKILNCYQHYYELRYSNKRVINWFPHFGEVSITYENQDFLMLPIQFMVLEMFTNTNQVHIIDILSAKFLATYTNKFRLDIIKSLIVSGLLKNQADTLLLKSTGEFKNNLIEIFFATSDYESVWDQQRQEEIIHSREEITNTVINSTLKYLDKAIEFNELFNIVKNKIHVFELDKCVFTNSIEYMCKQDYIEKIETDKYKKIHY
jgi:hypothetical protein